MNRQEFDSLEIEANAGPAVIGSHHLHIPRGYDCRRLIEIVRKEALEELEPGQNFGVSPFGYPVPINTLR